VDIYFGRGTADGPWDGPTGADVRLVQAHGGRVHYRFHVPAIRARIALSRVPDLVQEGGITVREVPDPERYDVPDVGVGFNRALRDSDVALFAELGGRVNYRWDSFNALSGHLPDQSIPALRRLVDVAYVAAASGSSCVL
jgi:hypothetical protein